MPINKVVVRYKNGEVKKGNTVDFAANKVAFHLQLTSKETLKISVEELKYVCFVEELKAVFFVKDFEGNKDRRDDYTDDVPGEGRKVQVEFFDGEVLIGYTPGYDPTRIGFFVVPADLQNNNDRIYVINSATKKVTFL